MTPKGEKGYAGAAEDFMALWEAFLELRRESSHPALDAVWDSLGVSEMRSRAAALLPIIDSAHEKAVAQGFDDSYDWEFIPWFLRERVYYDAKTVRFVVIGGVDSPESRWRHASVFVLSDTSSSEPPALYVDPYEAVKAANRIIDNNALEGYNIQHLRNSDGASTDTIFLATSDALESTVKVTRQNIILRSEKEIQT